MSQTLYSNSALLVLKRTSLNGDNTLLALNWQNCLQQVKNCIIFSSNIVQGCSQYWIQFIELNSACELFMAMKISSNCQTFCMINDGRGTFQCHTMDKFHNEMFSIYHLDWFNIFPVPRMTHYDQMLKKKKCLCPKCIQPFKREYIKKKLIVKSQGRSEFGLFITHNGNP